MLKPRPSSVEIAKRLTKFLVSSTLPKSRHLTSFPVLSSNLNQAKNYHNNVAEGHHHRHLSSASSTAAPKVIMTPPSSVISDEEDNSKFLVFLN